MSAHTSTDSALPQTAVCSAQSAGECFSPQATGAPGTERARWLSGRPGNVRPYDLRHAGVSLRLNAGVPPTQVAEWAGHSVEVLLKIYAKVIAGQDRVWEELIDDALGG